MRYFFHIRDNGFYRDEDGMELSGIESAQKVASETARSFMIQQIRGGSLNLSHQVEVHDERGQLVYTLRLRDAVHLSGAS